MDTNKDLTVSEAKNLMLCVVVFVGPRPTSSETLHALLNEHLGMNHGERWTLINHTGQAALIRYDASSDFYELTEIGLDLYKRLQILLVNTISALPQNF